MERWVNLNMACEVNVDRVVYLNKRVSGGIQDYPEEGRQLPKWVCWPKFWPKTENWK